MGNRFDGSSFIKYELLLSFVHGPLFDSQVVSTTLVLNHSVGWQSGDNIEWFVDLESEFLVKSLSLSGCLVSVDDLPSLIGAIGSIGNTNF